MSREVLQQALDALVHAEAGLADIGDADREPGDDLAWCEDRAAQALAKPREAIEALRAELAKPDGWQSIESAPKDGTALMLYTSEGVIEGAFSYGCWEQSPCYATYDGCGGVALHSQPTHWMPLPATPSAPE